MSKYAAQMTKGTTSVTVAVGSIEAPASTMRRIKISDLTFGSEATPADNMFRFEANRSTTASTGTAFTPVPLDSADAACVALAKTNNTVQGTNTASAILLTVAMNQRASMRWVAAPGSELIIPATASNGICFNTPVAGGTVAADIGAIFDE